MPKCANVVILVVATNILTLTIYSNVRYEHLPSLSGFPGSNEPDKPLPQPNQLSKIQTGRVIQSVMMEEEARTTFPSTNNPYDGIFEKRRKIMRDVCEDKKRHPTEPFTQDPTHLFVLQDRGISWCPVFKAGSSTWLATILELSSKSQAEKMYIKKSAGDNFLKQGRQAAPLLSRLTYGRYKAFMRQMNKTEVSFIVVRHPFERLVSAYRDKLERTHASNYLTDFYYKTYGKKIVQKFRPQALKKFGDDFFSAANNYGAPLPVAKNGRPSSDLPTFWEFVHFVIDSRKVAMDEHWKPTMNYCSLCIYNYDYVIKFEDYLNEGKAFLRTSNLVKYVNEDILERNINPNRPGEMSSAELTAKYFGMLSEDEIVKLYKVYEDDFRLFDYSFKLGNVVLPPPPTSSSSNSLQP